jgi:hypothetical protein
LGVFGRWADICPGKTVQVLPIYFSYKKWFFPLLGVFIWECDTSLERAETYLNYSEKLLDLGGTHKAAKGSKVGGK